MATEFPKFEEYVAIREGGWTDGGGKCSGCRREAPRLSASGDCEWCIQYRYGYDQAEHSVSRWLLGGAIRAALGEEMEWSLLRDVVDDAHTASVEANAEEWGRHDGASAASRDAKRLEQTDVAIKRLNAATARRKGESHLHPVSSDDEGEES